HEWTNADPYAVFRQLELRRDHLPQHQREVIGVELERVTIGAPADAFTTGGSECCFHTSRNAEIGLRLTFYCSVTQAHDESVTHTRTRSFCLSASSSASSSLAAENWFAPSPTDACSNARNRSSRSASGSALACN